ncbi:linear amide C-N hydrolase [Okeania sp. SIO2B3]|uniref:linear amide C-N hydrolase n=1 Tax=Okeania sp. SIO2B3 TaxID=2607784 RepID=UPI0013C1DAFF|nr:linear amide C-N hydrolase [Okeania sp. SIO2B3]NET40643.1 linear amide C-N hydrolase [Okeania sp. SIO2B3]
MTKKLVAVLAVLIAILAITVAPAAQACTRAVYKAGDARIVTGRTMDWFEDLESDLWAFPKGMKRNGEVGPDSIDWVSKYGSITTSGYDIATTDGMNEEGLVANVLYLAEADYGNLDGKPALSVGAWGQYALDNYANVAEAVEGLSAEPFRIIAADLPNGGSTSVHLSLSDATGDSAIFEYIDGKLVIHHGAEYDVMTNSPIYDDQIPLNAYWKQIGGLTFLPGTNRASDRFARASYYLGAVPEFNDPREAVAAAFSVIRNASVPLGITDESQPNISSTIWRTVSDQKSLTYYFESSISPNVFWVEMDKLNLQEDAETMKLELKGHPILVGEVSAMFEPADPFPWLAP